MYAEQLAVEQAIQENGGEPGFYMSEFDTPGYNWICPNTTQIPILNAQAPVSNDATYVNFQVEVYQCVEAQMYDEQNGIVSYADLEAK